jgi:hypothetical protein
MSRRVQTGSAAGLGGGPPAPPTEDDYLARLAKYIPAEVVALYVAMVAAVPDGHNSALWAIFVANAVLVPIYMWIVTSRDVGKGALWVQVVLATIAFPVWAFAMGGPFKTLGWYEGWMATLLLMFITVVFGLAKPKPGS